MTLAAAQVAAAIAARITGLPTTGSRVFVGVQGPVPEADVPCWRVNKGDESIETLTISYPARQEHTLTVELEGITRSVDALVPAMDALAAEALAALYASAPLHAARTTSIARRIQNADGEASVGIVTVTVVCTYRTLQNDPETIL